MCPILVVVTDVLVHQTFQVAFVDNNHLVEQVPAAAADPARGDTVLPWTSEAGPLRLDAEALHRVDYFFIELCATIKDQIAGRGVVGKRLAQLAERPRRCTVVWSHYTEGCAAGRAR